MRKYLDEAGLHRHRNADALQGDAGRRARLSGAVPHASGQVLRPAAVAADLQAVADGRGIRPLLPDRAVLPRRGPARRPPAGIHPARHRDLVPRPARDHQDLMEGLVRAICSSEVLDVELPDPLPAHDLCRRRCAATGRTSRTCAFRSKFTELTDLVKGCDFKVFAAPRPICQRPRGRACACRGGRRCRARKSTTTRQFVAHLRRQGSGLCQGQRCHPPMARQWLAVADRQVPVRRRVARRSSSAPGAQNGDLIFFGADRAKVVNEALGALRLKIGHEQGTSPSRLEAAVGGGLPDVRIRRRRRPLGRHAPSVHRAQGLATRSCWNGSGQLPGQGLRHGAQWLGNRRRFGAYPPRGSAGARSFAA